MKKLFLLVFVFCLPCAALATPFIVCDPQAGVTHYQIAGDPFWTVNVPAQADGSIRTDVGNIAAGVHSLQVKACRTADGWPEVCSAAAPFVFTRPAAPVVPSTIRLVP